MIKGLFEIEPEWKEKWEGMPEYIGRNLEWGSITIRFRSKEDQQEFAEFLGQTITELTKSLWYPKPEKGTLKPKFIDSTRIIPTYPIYVISKGRWESRMTSKALEKINVPYHIVVEPQEYDNYAEVIDKEKVLTLPFSNLGQGSIPARNWVWEHAISTGSERHWILDDNIQSFIRYNDNKKTEVTNGEIFCHCEEFTDRFSNVAISGMNYMMFVKQEDFVPPYYLNTRVYSCILIRNDIPYRWRGRYNEDTDLSLRALKDGWCTVLFNTFLALKTPTMTMKGGNTDELYQEDGRLLMAQSLQEQHPDVVKVTRKWNRWQHHVNYKPFKKNKLILKSE